MTEETTLADDAEMPVVATPESIEETKPKAPEKRKIAILGTTPSRMEGPIGDESDWEIWTIGPGGKDTHRWDRLYEIHGVWPDSFEGYLGELRKVEPPQEVWTMQPIGGDAPANKVYPRDAVLEKFLRGVWFSSSISWCIAHALYEGGVEELGLWGIDLESGEEYISQYIGCAHLLDVARLMGITVHMPQGCGLERDFRPYPDRYETHFALVSEKKTSWLQNMVAQVESEFENHKSVVHRMEGQLLLHQNWYNEHRNQTIGELINPQLLQNMEMELQNASRHLGTLAANLNQLRGELEATQFYRRMYCQGLNEPDYFPIR
jgi:hypothetical protein